jgi:hypothetical protein
MDIGKLLLLAGVFMMIMGLFFVLGFRGLPGDIVVQKKNFTFALPIVTCIVLSLIFSLALYLIRR